MGRTGRYRATLSIGGHYRVLGLFDTPEEAAQTRDSANDQIDNYHWMHDQGGIALFAYNRRNEPLDPESLVPHHIRFALFHSQCLKHGVSGIGIETGLEFGEQFARYRGDIGHTGHR